MTEAKLIWRQKSRNSIWSKSNRKEILHYLVFVNLKVCKSDVTQTQTVYSAVVYPSANRVMAEEFPSFEQALDLIAWIETNGLPNWRDIG